MGGQCLGKVLDVSVMSLLNTFCVHCLTDYTCFHIRCTLTYNIRSQKTQMFSFNSQQIESGTFH